MRVEVCAELGVNHGGAVDEALRLVDMAAECGADSVKGQLYRAELLEHPGPRREMLQQYQLTVEQWDRVGAHARAQGLRFGLSAFDLDSMREAGAVSDFVKVASGDLHWRELVREAGHTEREVWLSTGMHCSLDAALAWGGIPAGQPGVVLHCVSAYPAPARDCNMVKALGELERNCQGARIGWSDHTEGPWCAVAAVACGASVIERHITTDRGQAGPDHGASDDRAALLEYVHAIRTAERACTVTGQKRLMPSEHATRDLAWRQQDGMRPCAASE